MANLSVNTSLFFANCSRRWLGCYQIGTGVRWRFFAAAEMDYHDLLEYMSLDGKLTPNITSGVDDGVIYSFDYHTRSVVTPCIRVVD